MLHHSMDRVLFVPRDPCYSGEYVLNPQARQCLQILQWMRILPAQPRIALLPSQINSHLAALWSCGRRSRRLSWVSVVTDANDMSNPGHRVTLTADQFAGANPMAGDGATAALRLGRRHRRGLLGLAYVQLLWERGLILLHDALPRPLNRHPVCTPDGPT